MTHIFSAKFYLFWTSFALKLIIILLPFPISKSKTFLRESEGVKSFTIDKVNMQFGACQARIG